MQAPDPKKDQSKAAGSTSGAASPLDRYTVAPKNTGSDAAGNKSPYYQPQAPSVSLPKGGGALKGIDEKFTVNAANGSMSFEVPLPLTPGRGGFTPQLSLQYNSGSGNSAFGLGWNLSLPSIQRKTDKKLPLYDDVNETDVFLLAGAEDLVPILIEDEGELIPQIIVTEEIVDTGTTTATYTFTVKRYRPRIEGLYARIEYIRRTGTAHRWWKVTTRDNTVIYYGLTPDACICDPEDESRIYKWLPQISYDAKGNVMQYFYRKEDFASIPSAVHETNRRNGSAPCTNTYLKSLAWCNVTPYTPVNRYQPVLLSPPESGFFSDGVLGCAYLMQAVFDYGDHSATAPQPRYDLGFQWDVRADPFSDFRAGFEIRTWRRCKRVLMFHYFQELAGGEPVLVRSLDIAYALGATPAGYAEADQVKTLTLKGYIKTGDETYHAKAMPPTEFFYAEPGWDTTVHDMPQDALEHAPQGLSGSFQWIDFWGEGITGILTEQANAWYYKRNLGNASFTHAVAVAEKPSLQGLGNSLQWQDLDADGRRQLVTRNTMLPGYFELGDDQQWQSFQSFHDNINIDWDNPFTRLLDLDGDGRADVLITEDRVWKWYHNAGKQGYTEGGYAGIFINEEQGPRMLHNDKQQTIFLADMNGDGLTDIVRIKNGEVCWWPNMGYGKFGARVSMSNAPIFDVSDIFDPQRIVLADITGTGAADILYYGFDTCMAWLNLSGNAWAAGVPLPAFGGAEQYSKIAVVDLLGTGTGCLVWSSPLLHYAAQPMRYMDLMGGNKPYLLHQYVSGMGKRTTISYKSSVSYYIADEQKNMPWATRLPFPVMCISSVKTEDVISDTSYLNSYTYHHGYYDHDEREFRGFGRVEITDSETTGSLSQPPVLTKSWYHTGAWMRERTLLQAFAEEYFPLGSDMELPASTEIPANLSPDEQREAYRALKGMALRQEVYAPDASALANIPYSVSTNTYCVRREQPLAHNRNAVFYAYKQQSLSFSCERQLNDPRVLHEFTLKVDEYGNVLKAAKVAYPRFGAIGAPGEITSVQGRMLITYTETSHTEDLITDDVYHLPLPCEVQEFEITGIEQDGILWQPEEILDEIGHTSLLEYTEAPAAPRQKRLLSRRIIIYMNDEDGSALSFGQVGPRGLPYQQYTLAFTNEMLTGSAYYNDRITDTMSMLVTDGGYVPENYIPGIGSEVTTRYWLLGGTVTYDTAHFYTPIMYTDPWGFNTAIIYWDDAGTNYYLLPQSVENSIGNRTTVNEYNWYNLQPSRITDANQNESRMLYDALGLPVAVAVMEKDGSVAGDTLAGIDVLDEGDLIDAFFDDPVTHAATALQGATWRCLYDYSVAPARIAMLAREKHYSDDPDSPALIRITYTDGMGRVAMHKALTAPAEGSITTRWTGTGKTIYNNKGNVVMQYEPYFSNTHAYDTAEQAAMASVTAKVLYDALGRVLRTDMPDGSYTKTKWNAWKQVIYDNNDTVKGSAWYTARMPGGALHSNTQERLAREKAEKHSNTPTIIHLDTLARPFYTIQHNRVPNVTNPLVWEDEYYASYVDLDIQGNRLAIHDARGLTPLTYNYNMLQAVIMQVSVDSGSQCMLVDVGGQPIYSWDADNRMFRIAYDEIRRMTAKEVTPSGGSTKVLQKIIYGEGQTDDTLHNLRGMPYKVYDGAGMQTISDYDFKGQPLAIERWNVRDYIEHPDWTSPGSLVFDGFASGIITTSTTYDALGRPVSITTPDASITSNTYDKTGQLFNVHVAGGPDSIDTDIINEIYYNARGQRLKVKFENGSTTTYEYDSNTFRVTRIRTIRISDSIDLQDLRYWYDPVGNITLQTDDAQQDVFYDNTVAEPTNDYTYDALYRVIRCAGREHVASSSPVVPEPTSYNDNWRAAITPLRSDAAAMRPYVQYYTYDEVGNMLKMKHTTTGGDGNWTRNFYIDTVSNRLAGTDIGSNGGGSETYTYDARGNIVRGMNHLYDDSGTVDSMYYNEENRLEKVLLTSDDTAYYNYDNDGQRVRKAIDHIGSPRGYITRYMGQWEMYQITDHPLNFQYVQYEQQRLNVADDTGRVALINYTPFMPPGSFPAAPYTSPYSIRYQYGNHLGSASLALSDAADVISYEEYHPYGTTSHQAADSIAETSLKRYRFVNKEKDDETGLYYMGARYYCPWLAQWLAVDPLESKYSPESPYNYCHNNPVKHIDPTGMGVQINDPKMFTANTNSEERKVVNPDNPDEVKSADGYRDIYSTIYIYSNEQGVNTDDIAATLKTDIENQYNNKGTSGSNPYFGAYTTDGKLLQLRFHINVESVRTPEGARAKLTSLTDNQKVMSNFFYVNTDQNYGWAAIGGSSGTISINTDANHPHQLSHEFAHIMNWGISLHIGLYQRDVQQPDSAAVIFDHSGATARDMVNASGNLVVQTNVPVGIRNPKKYAGNFAESIMKPVPGGRRHVTQADINQLGRFSSTMGLFSDPIRHSTYKNNSISIFNNLREVRIAGDLQSHGH